MMFDQFKLALAVVDIGSIVAFFLTFNPVILIYLLVFNLLVVLTDTLRKGMIVHKRGEPMVDLPDMIPVNPLTGNKAGPINLFGDVEKEIQPEIKPKQELPVKPISVRREPEQPRQNFSSSSGPKDKEREEMESVLKEWIS